MTAIPAAPASLPLGDHRPDLLPVRMLNEFTYCPRLGYLEWVQGEWAENLDTREGAFGHRVVDQPDRKQPPTADKATDETTIHARSVSLSAPVEGLTAKLDLLELEGVVATPVDYKKGKAPDIPEGAYEPVRVQLCAQGLILRENGYRCDSGVIYFIASKRRVTILFDDALVERTRELARAFLRTAEAGACPPPLVDSPKCPRCSLVGICLPDEVNALRSTDAGGAELPTPQSNGPVRRTPNGLRHLVPSRGNALPLYVQQQGAFVGKSGDRITISLKGEQLSSVRMLDVSQVCAFGSVMFSAQAISELVRRGTPICHFSYGGWLNAMTLGMVHKNVELRIRQYAVASDAAASLELARAMVAGKMRNCRTLLRRRLGDRHHPAVRDLLEFRRRAERAACTETLLGLEGMAARTYFAEFFQQLPAWSRGDVDGRNRRPPTDPANAVLSFLYSMLAKELAVTLQAVGFDPMLGVYHRPRYGRPSLALDLAEEFRPLVADSTALMLFNNGELNEASFLCRAGAVAMTDAGRRATLASFERRLSTEITHPLFGYQISYRRVFEVQARLLARTLLGELPRYPSFITR